MAILEIQTGVKNPILRKRSAEIKKVDAGLKKFAKDLKETMLSQDGLGLAAPQVAQNIRMIAITLDYKSDNAKIIIMINPVILAKSEEMDLKEEGCLSLPNVFKNVWRHKNIIVDFINLNGESHSLKLSGLDARVVQHETDHLDGVLFVDRVEEKIKTE
ncbi:MAG: peptide deformylase [Candidatus Gracilibacteria bacterium]|jgi:peptide deformylase